MPLSHLAAPGGLGAWHPYPPMHLTLFGPQRGPGGVLAGRGRWGTWVPGCLVGLWPGYSGARGIVPGQVLMGNMFDNSLITMGAKLLCGLGKKAWSGEDCLSGSLGL